MPAVDECALPRSLVEHFEHAAHGRPVRALLELLRPISTTPWLEASAS
jgi:hypothetical protein